MKRPRRNAFNLSYESKLTLNMGELVPIMCMPVVPGDKFRVKTESLVRLVPLVAPMMHRVNVFTHYFFVPNRLVWNEWEDFITKGVDGEDMPMFPKIQINQDSHLVSSASLIKEYFGDSSLWDYLGLPTISACGNKSYDVVNGVKVPNGFQVSALPFRANGNLQLSVSKSDVTFSVGIKSGSLTSQSHNLQNSKECLGGAFKIEVTFNVDFS